MCALPNVNVDIGIGECVSSVDKILTRRHQRAADYFADLVDDLEAVSEIVNTLDNLFIELIRGFESSNLLQNKNKLNVHLEETMKYLTKRELLKPLEDFIGNIEAAAYTKKLKPKKYRDLVSALRSISKRLNEYREQLGRGAITGVGQMKDWNLMTLWERGNDVLKDRFEWRDLLEIAEEVHRNQDFGLSDSIHRLIGQAKGHAKAAVM